MTAAADVDLPKARWPALAIFAAVLAASRQAAFWPALVAAYVVVRWLKSRYLVGVPWTLEKQDAGSATFVVDLALAKVHKTYEIAKSDPKNRHYDLTATPGSGARLGAGCHVGHRYRARRPVGRQRAARIARRSHVGEHS